MRRPPQAPKTVPEADYGQVQAAAQRRDSYDDHFGNQPVELLPDTGPDLPPEWLLVVRRWGPDLYDAALYSGNCPCVWWRLPDPFARSAQEAAARARTEVYRHLRRCPKKGFVRPVDLPPLSQVGDRL